MQSANIDVTKIIKDALYKGKKGTYLNIVCHDNREGRDEYGNDGFVTQDLGKLRREAGEKSPIIGNWKHIEKREPKPAAVAPPPPAAAEECDDVPF